MITRIALPLLFALCVATALPAQSLFNNVDYKGARSHPYDVLHIAMDLRIDDAKKEVSGIVRHQIVSLAPVLKELRMDAGESMKFRSITVDGAPAMYRHSKDTLFITMPRVRAYGDTFVVAIDYSVIPRKGMYFISPDSSVPGRRNQVWTQGEGEDNRYWLPMYDYPNDRATSELRATVRRDWKLLSNGELKSTTQNNDGTATWHWMMDKPHSGYLIMLAAGDFLVTRDTVDGLPLEYWSYPDQADRVKATFSRTPAVIRFYNKMIGIRYPWNKYAQVMIADFMFGGMENTTATTLNDAYMVDQRGLLDFNPDGVISHEAGHQWYGDLVTNRSWGHLWLHESYATYLEARFMGDYYGQEQYQKEMFDNGQAGINIDRDQGRDPIVNGNGVTSNLYPRGARVLHMLNNIVGEELFWRANRLYLQRFGYKVAETNDLKIAFEDATGQNLDWFFDEWLYKAGYPKYDVNYTYQKDSLYLHVRQTQKRDSLTGLFRMPMPLELHLKNRVQTDTLWVAKEDQTFAISATEKPRFVIFDAGDVTMKTVNFPRTDEELIAQLSAPRMIDRLLAVRELTSITRPVQGSPTDTSKSRTGMPTTASRLTISKSLRDAFMNEPSKFVRQEIVDNATFLDTTSALQILTTALRDSTINVRRSAVEMLYLVRDPKQRADLMRPMLNDSSYGIVSSIVTSLASVDPTGLEQTLRNIKGIRGRRDGMSQAWLGAVGKGRYNGLVDDVVEFTGGPYNVGTRAQAYSVLAKLDTTTRGMRESIIRGVRDASTNVRSAAVMAARNHLDKDLRDMLAGVVNTLADDTKESVKKLLQK